MSTTKVLAGAKSPEALSVKIDRGQSGVDLSTPIGVYFSLKPAEGGSVVKWTAAITAKSSTQLTAKYMFNANGQDVSRVRTYNVTPVLQFTGGGERRCYTFVLQVVDALEG